MAKAGKSPQERQAEIRQAFDEIAAQVPKVFESDNYRAWLDMSSRFHSYSMNNLILISLQKPDATMVAGFQSWKANFNRSVNRGEKGIGILAPSPYTYSMEVDRTDADGNKVVGRDGKPEKELREFQGMRWRKVYVFDVSQTSGEPLPELAREMTGNSKEAYDLLEAVCAVCDAPVSFRTKQEDAHLARAHGYYSFDTGEIVVDGGAALDQKAKTLIHEWAHSRLHGKDDGKSREQREIEADSTAYVVSRYFGLDTSAYSFEYVASWAAGMDAKELKSILDGIHKNADGMICAIDEMYEKVREKNRDLVIDEGTGLEADPERDEVSGAAMAPERDGAAGPVEAPESETVSATAMAAERDGAAGPVEAPEGETVSVTAMASERDAAAKAAAAPEDETVSVTAMASERDAAAEAEAVPEGGTASGAAASLSERDAESEVQAEPEEMAGIQAEAEAAKRGLLLQAMEAAGYWYDEMSSSGEELRFSDRFGQPMYVEGWKDLEEWLEGVVFDDPEVSDRVEKILHPEHFSDLRSEPAGNLTEGSVAGPLEGPVKEADVSPAVQKAPKASKAPVQPPERIEDFGEKIGGARKDIWKARGLAVSDLNTMNDAERASYVKKDSIWPRPDYRELEKSGMPRVVCYFMKTVRDRVPTRPSVPRKGAAAEQERYIGFVSAVRDAVMACRTTEDIRKLSTFFMDNGFCQKNGDAVFASYEPTQKAGRYLDNKLFSAMRGGINLERLEADMAKKEFLMSEREKILNGFRFVALDGKNASLRDQGRCAILHHHGGFTYAFPAQGVNLGQAKPWEWLVIKGNSVLAAGLPGREACIQYVLDEDKKAKAAAMAAARGSVEKDGDGDGRQDGYSSGKESAKARRRVLKPPQLEQIEREGGGDYRKGKDVSGQAYLDDFGFRGGEFGNWTSQNDRQASLNMGYDALRDLAKALGIPDRDISLGGRLSIAFGSRGKGPALAHYEPMREVINLTKMKGPGSLGHEWIHAMDDYIGRSLGLGNGKTAGFLSEAAAPRYGDRLPESFSKLMDALRYTTRTGEEMVRDTRDSLDKSCDIFKRNLDRITAAGRTPEQEEKRQALIEAVIEEARTSYGYQAATLNRRGKTVYDKTPSPAYQALIDHQALQGDHNPDNEHNRAWANVQRSAIGRSADLLDNHPDQLRTRRVQTDFYKDAAFIGANYSRSGPGYWTSGCELLARVGAAYIKDKCAAMGIRNDYLSGHADAFPIRDDDGNPHYISPQGAERAAINQAFDRFFEEMREKGLFHAPEEKRGLEEARTAAEKETDMDLRNFLQEGEMVVEFATTESPAFNTGAITSQMIASSELPLDRQDIAGWLEETLHRLKDAGIPDRNIESMTGMRRDEDIPEETESISIDLGYSIPGQLLWMEPLEGKNLDDVIAGAEKEASCRTAGNTACLLEEITPSNTKENGVTHPLRENAQKRFDPLEI